MHPQAETLLRSLGFETSRFRSKSWSEFAKPGAPGPRFCLYRLRQRSGRDVPGLAEWADDGSLGDRGPRFAIGTDAEVALAFKDTYRMLAQRIGVLQTFPFGRSIT